MKRFICALALVALVALAPSAQAQRRVRTQAIQRTINVQVGDVIDANGRAIAQVRVPITGQTETIRLASGGRVAVQMRNGQAVGSQAFDPSGRPLSASVQNTTRAGHRTIIIIIRSGGSTTVIVIRL